MSSHHNTTLNFSHAPYKYKDVKSNEDREIKMAEIRLRYVQLFRDAYSSPGEKDANILIKKSEALWEKLSNQKSLGNQIISNLAPNPT